MSISYKEKKTFLKVGNYLIVRRTGFSHEGFYVVKVATEKPLSVLVHTGTDEIWKREFFRIAWQETLSYDENSQNFLQTMQNKERVSTGLKELGAKDGFKDLALSFPCWL